MHLNIVSKEYICNDLYILFTAGYRIVYPVIPKIHGFTYNNRFIWSFLQ